MTKQSAAIAREEQEAWKEHAKSEAMRRADAAKQTRQEDKQELAKRRQAVDMDKARELNMVRFKQQQLSDIKKMLARPIKTPTAEELGLADVMAGVTGSGGDPLDGFATRGEEEPLDPTLGNTGGGIGGVPLAPAKLQVSGEGVPAAS